MKDKLITEFDEKLWYMPIEKIDVKINSIMKFESKRRQKFNIKN